jgi:hypothetical protein
MGGTTRLVLDTALVERLRGGPLDEIDDLEAARSLAQLTRDELLAFGTSGGSRLTDQQTVAVLRSVRTMLKRQGIEFEPPFRDFDGFRDYWVNQGMKGSYALAEAT